jgi:predicted ArsR family transcriptional regulator
VLLESPVRRTIVDLLVNLPFQAGTAEASGLTATQLAEKLGLHPTTVRFHLDQLADGQLVESESRAGRVGRPRKIYRFKPGSLSPLSQGEAYQALAELLAESWDETDNGVPLTPEQAGQRWAAAHSRGDGPEPPAQTLGAWLGKVGQTVDMLRRWGYTPELRTSNEGRTVELTLVDCPLLALAHSKPEVVCGVHRGLLRGAMDAVGETDTEITLRPFVGDGRCLAAITTQTRLAADGGADAIEDEEKARD